MPSSPGDRFVRMRKESDGVLSGAARRLARIRIPFKSPSLLDRSAPYFSGIKRFGISKFQHYWQDPFHTLLNLPWGRFIAIFFITYVLEFLVFAFLFRAQSDTCIIGMNGKFANALWMSSRTASTLGYDSIHPNPECILTNLTVMTQVIASSLVNFIMLGLVFARFSAPFKRASTIRFSSVMVAFPHPSGYWALSLRVANIRKHQLLKPCLRMVLTAADSITPSNYNFEHLTIEAHSAQETNLELGFPANVTHIITPSSPLYNLSLLEMDTRMMEILMFVDGIDAMTSKNMSARHGYSTNEVHMNEVFQPLHLEMRGGALGLDFSGFDLTALASVELLGAHNADPGLAERPLPEVQSHMWHLRHMTFKRLTDKDPHHHSATARTSSPSAPEDAFTAPPHPLSRPPGLPPLPPLATSSNNSTGSGTGGSGAAATGTTAGPSSSGPHLTPISTNPFLSSSGGGGMSPPGNAGITTAGGGAAGSSGGGSSWMGFGVTLQPAGASASAAVAGAATGALPAGPVRISTFLNAQSGLESFADMTSAHQQSVSSTNLLSPAQQQQYSHHPQPQVHQWPGGGPTAQMQPQGAQQQSRGWGLMGSSLGGIGGSGGGGGGASSSSSAAVGGVYQQQQQQPLLGGQQHVGLGGSLLSQRQGTGRGGGGGGGAGGSPMGGGFGGGGVELEMLPTSSLAVEPRINGGGVGGGR